MKKYFLALFVAFPLLAGAQSVVATDLVGKVPLIFSNSGNVYSANTLAVDVINRARYGLAPVSDGVSATAGALFKGSDGTAVPVTVSGKIPNVSAAAAIGRFLGKTLPLLSTGYALFDLARELGFDVNNSTGVVVVRTATQGGAQCSPYVAPSGYPGDGWSPVWGCKQAPTGVFYWGWDKYSCYQDGSCPHEFLNVEPAGSGVNVVTYSPSTQQALVDAIAAKSGWPSTSAIARATADAVASGETIVIPTTTVTGPATSPGPQQVKIDTATGKTTTTVTTNNYNYSGPTITNTTSTVSTVTNTSTGVVESTTATEEKPLPPPEVCGIAGKAACNVKVDETGTPDGKLATPSDTLKTEMQKLDDKLATIGSTDGMNTGWGLTPFWLTQGTCRAVDIMSFPAKLNIAPLSFNICPQLSTIYTLMDLLWIVWTFTAVVAMSLRVTTGGG